MVKTKTNKKKTKKKKRTDEEFDERSRKYMIPIKRRSQTGRREEEGTGGWKAHMPPVVEHRMTYKPTCLRVSEKVTLKPACSATEAS